MFSFSAREKVAHKALIPNVGCVKPCERARVSVGAGERAQEEIQRERERGRKY